MITAEIISQLGNLVDSGYHVRIGNVPWSNGYDYKWEVCFFAGVGRPLAHAVHTNLEEAVKDALRQVNGVN